MLHKKSEYKLQYSKMNTDLRRKIWQDNITVRKSRLLTNQATHYWEYQLRDENCDCDISEEDDQGPLPPHVKKHKELTGQYKQKCEPSLPASSEKLHSASEIGIQTTKCSGDEPDNREEELMNNMGSLTVGNRQSRSVSPALLSARPRTGASVTRTSRRLHAEPKRTHFVPFGWNEAKTDVGHKLTYNTSAPKKQVHASAVLASQRRKAEVEQCLAQEQLCRQTHQMRSRERLLTKILYKELSGIQEEFSRQTVSSSSSQWMSEYQEQFSVRSSGRGPRTVSAPPAPRPVSWRCS